MTAVSKVLVIGAGIGGLTAAVALRRQSIEVDVVEIAPSLAVYGVGIIQPNNTMRAFNKIGLASACVEAGAAFPGWQIFSEQGDLLMQAPSPTLAAPEYPAVNGITRPRLHEILSGAAYDMGANIRLGESLADFVQRDDGVDVTFASGGSGEYDLVVACDGILSDMRQRLFPDVGAPKFTGLGVWRYNFPRPAGMEWGGIYFGRDTKVGLVPLADELIYMFLVTAEPDNPRYDGPGLADEMRGRLSNYGGLVAKLAPMIVDPAQVVYKPMHNVMMPRPWHKGRVIVIGDAAHATTPHLAQGAAMAIEDAVLLAELLGDEGPVSTILQEFTERRFGRSKFVVESSRQLVDWELEAWSGIRNPEANPGGLLHEATVALMEDY